MGQLVSKVARGRRVAPEQTENQQRQPQTQTGAGSRLAQSRRGARNLSEAELAERRRAAQAAAQEAAAERRRAAAEVAAQLRSVPLDSRRNVNRPVGNRSVVAESRRQYALQEKKKELKNKIRSEKEDIVYKMKKPALIVDPMGPGDKEPRMTLAVTPSLVKKYDKLNALDEMLKDVENRQQLDNLPSYKKGGRVRKTGAALVHKDEVVIPAHRVKAVKKAVKKAGLKPIA